MSTISSAHAPAARPDFDAAARDRVQPRAWAWVMLVASAVSVLVAGALGTALILAHTPRWPAIDAGFFFWFIAACGLTIVSLGLRALRWVFLLRRAGVRIPIRDATIGYCSGLTLLVTPMLLGETAVRAIVHKARNDVPVSITCIVNVWERWLDLVAVAMIV